MLQQRGHQVTSLVRQSSNTSFLHSIGARLAVADLETQPERLPALVAGHDQVFHLAAATRAIRSRDMITTNVTMVRHLYRACLAQDIPPQVLVVSSLAASGPSRRGQPLDERSPLRPVSNYGRSKQQAEDVVRQFADRVPTTILRPPIVFGDRDPDFFQLYRFIERTGWHLVPTFSTFDFSLIHVDDLVTAMIGLAQSGERVDPGAPINEGSGVYFAADPQVVTYSQLGRMIGQALQQRRTRVLRIARPCLWAFAMMNELKARLRQHAELLNIDKYREAVGGSWACSGNKLTQHTGFQVAYPLAKRLRQTAQELRHRGWLPPSKQPPRPQAPRNPLSDPF